MPRINSVEDIRRYYPDLLEEFVREVRAEVGNESFDLAEAYQRWAYKVTEERRVRPSEEEQRRLAEVLRKRLVEGDLTPPAQDEDPAMSTLRRLIVEGT